MAASRLAVLLLALAIAVLIQAEAQIDSKRAARILRRVDQLLDGPPPDHILAFELLLNYEEELSADVEFQWRIAKACRLSGLAFGFQGNDDKRKELLFQAAEYAKTALATDPNHFQVQKWYAVTIGGLGDYVSNNDKFKNGITFKEHIDRALELNPNDAELHYLIGRYCYEVAMLSWFERSMASALFGDLPRTTVDQALDHFLKAERYQTKPLKENKRFIALCYIQKYDYFEAMKWIEEGVRVPIITDEDKVAHKDLADMFLKYAIYVTS